MRLFNRDSKIESRICSADSDYAWQRRVYAQPINRAIATKRFRTNQNIASHKSRGHRTAAFHARVPFARQISFKILETLSDAQSVRASRERADIRCSRKSSLRCGAFRVSQSSATVRFQQRGRAMASIVTASFNRDNVRPLRRERTQISVRPVEFAGSSTYSAYRRQTSVTPTRAN